MLRNLLRKSKKSSRINSFFPSSKSSHALIHHRRLLCESLEDRRLLNGVTLITHGFGDNADGWVKSMANAVVCEISTRFGCASTDVAEIKLTVNSDLTVTPTWDNQVNLSTSNCSETVVRLDWSAVASFTFTSTVDIAATVAPCLYKPLSTFGLSGMTTPLADGPIQLIGHSRGGSLVGELALDLGMRGLWVDQVTTLDPHPWSLATDASMTAWNNVVFWDNYWEDSAIYPHGQSINGTNNNYLSFPDGAYPDTVPLNDDGYHSDVHLWYHGTIDTSSTASDGSYVVPSDWYADLQGPRNDIGYYFSRIDGGDRSSYAASDGLLWSDLGSRTPVACTAPSASAWDNVEISSVQQDVFLSQGTTLPVDLKYEAIGDTQITVGFDTDTNPYNNSGITFQSSVPAPSSNGDAFSYVNKTLPTNGLAPGDTYYVYAEITQAGNTRYYYASGKVHVTVNPPSSHVAIIGSADVTTSGIPLPTSSSDLPQIPGISFTNLDPGNISAASLAPFDTAVINVASPQMNEDISTLSSSAKQALVSFLGTGHKIIIYDAECLPQDYSWLPFPFTTDNPGQMEAHGTLEIVEDNTLSSSNSASPYYIDTNWLSANAEVGDANVMMTYDPHWDIDMTANNIDGITGPVHVYAEYSSDSVNNGLIIYNGLDMDEMGDGINTLAKVWMQELAQPYNPSSLPHSVSVVGIDVAQDKNSQSVGGTHTVFARITDQNGIAQSNVAVSFYILSGPNAGMESGGVYVPANRMTDVNGNVSFTYTSNGQVGSDLIEAEFTNSKGTLIHSVQLTVNWSTVPTTMPTVVISRAKSQADPTNNWPIHFNVVFGEAVSDFTTGDVTLSGTAGATIAIVTPVGTDGTTYDVAVSGMTGSGTVIANIADDVAHDSVGNPNAASTSTDNSVNFVVSGTPRFVINGPNSGTYAPGQPITITWTANNISGNKVISLCLDRDTKLWNGNERWIEIDKVPAANCNGSYTIDPGNYPPGTYYIGGYMYDKNIWTFTESHAPTQITILTPEFNITGPTSGIYAPGQSITVTWTADKVSANDVISLCLDQDTKLWNGNERWIEIDKVAAANGNGSYTIDPANFLPGTYYVSGYVYDKKLWTFTESHASAPITIPAPTFKLNGPTSGTFAPGQPVTITWTAGNVSSNSVISLCLDRDLWLWSGTERWIEIDKVAASNGNGSYTFDPGNFLPGTYYIGGYMYDKKLWTFTNSHLFTPITIPAPTFTLTGPTSGSYSPGQLLTITWTAGNVPSNSVISLCLDTDTKLWNGNEKWIEIDKVAATNGNGSYNFDPGNFLPGTYYIGGYIYDKKLWTFTESHSTQPISLTLNSNGALSNLSIKDLQTSEVGVNVSNNPDINLFLNTDYYFHSNDLLTLNYRSEPKITCENRENVEADIPFLPTDKEEELAATDLVLQNQDTWLGGNTEYLMGNV